MKKEMLLAIVIVSMVSLVAFAGHFIDVLPPASATGCTPVSNGYDYNCSNDTTAPAMILGAPLSPFVRTSAQLQSLTPTTTGQVVIISSATQWNSGKAGVCISTGIGQGAWVAVSSLTAITTCN